MLKMRHSKPESRRQSSSATNRTSTSRRYESSSKICEPMWACTPTSSRWTASRRRRTASSARPSASPKPNLLSCWPVCTKSCVFGRTPGVTRTRTCCRCRRAAAAASRRRDLLERVDDEVPDTGVEPVLDLGDRLVVAVEVDALGGKASGAGRGQLAAGGDVQREVLLGHQLAHRPAAEGLARVDDLVEVGARPEGRVIGAALVAQRLLVVDEQRRAELVRQVHDVAAADLEVAGGVVHGGVRVDERVRHGGNPTIRCTRGQGARGGAAPPAPVSTRCRGAPRRPRRSSA